MKYDSYNHLIEVNEDSKTLSIYRVGNDADRQFYTSVKLPDKNWEDDPDAIQKFCQMLGENILLDSPQARRLLKILKE